MGDGLQILSVGFESYSRPSELFFLKNWRYLGGFPVFPFARTSQPDHGRNSQFIENEIDFLQEFLLKTQVAQAHYESPEQHYPA